MPLGAIPGLMGLPVARQFPASEQEPTAFVLLEAERARHRSVETTLTGVAEISCDELVAPGSVTR